MQQAFQVEVGTFADQFQFEHEGLADCLTAAEFEDLQIVREAFDTQAEMGLVGRGEHSLFLRSMSLGSGSYRSMNRPAILRERRAGGWAHSTFLPGHRTETLRPGRCLAEAVSCGLGQYLGGERGTPVVG